MPIINGLRIREEEAVRATNCINNIFKELKEIQGIKAQWTLMRNNVSRITKIVESQKERNEQSDEHINLMWESSAARSTKLEL